MNAALSLSLHRLLPLPLRERLAARPSGIWHQEVSWSGDGDCIFVRAPSGTGKTTLIHQLYGLRHDYDGGISWGRQTLQHMQPEPLSQLRRESVSIIFQDMRLFPTLTAWENLEIKRTLTGFVAANRVRSWMETLGITDRADRPAATLSYGEQQRVAIIRALLQPFRWLLMDEPFSHLDQANTALAAGLIEAAVADQGAAMLLTDLDDNAHFPYSQKLML